MVHLFDLPMRHFDNVYQITADLNMKPSVHSPCECFRHTSQTVVKHKRRTTEIPDCDTINETLAAQQDVCI